MVEAARSALGVIAVVVLTGAGLGSVGFSFDAAPTTINRMDRRLGDRLPRPMPAPSPIVKGIGDDADPLVRAKSYLDAETGQLCRGSVIDRTCR
jgi:hypothetical protein